VLVSAPTLSLPQAGPEGAKSAARAKESQRFYFINCHHERSEMPYKVTVSRLDGSQIGANSIIDGRTPKPGELIRVKCGHVVVNALVELVVERSAFDLVTAKEVE